MPVLVFWLTNIRTADVRDFEADHEIVGDAVKKVSRQPQYRIDAMEIGVFVALAKYLKLGVREVVELD